MKWVAVFVCALSLGGCVASETSVNNDYVDEVNRIQTEGTERSKELAGQLENADSRAETVAALDGGIQATADAREQLEALDPPEEVADLHQQIIDLNRESENVAQDIKDAYIDGDDAALRAATQKLAHVGPQLLQLISEINDKLAS